jgi:hypothetical protein
MQSAFSIETFVLVLILMSYVCTAQFLQVRQVPSPQSSAPIRTLIRRRDPPGRPNRHPNKTRLPSIHNVLQLDVLHLHPAAHHLLSRLQPQEVAVLPAYQPDRLSGRAWDDLHVYCAVGVYQLHQSHTV